MNKIMIITLTVLLAPIYIMSSNEQIVPEFYNYCIQQYNKQNNSNLLVKPERINNKIAQEQLKNLAESICFSGVHPKNCVEYKHAKIFLNNLSSDHEFTGKASQLTEAFIKINRSGFYS